MASPMAAERRAIRNIFHQELLVHANRDPEECRRFCEKYYAEEVMGIHAHHTSHPTTNRVRDHYDPVETLLEFHGNMFKHYSFCTKMYHTLIWLDINHQTSTSPQYKCAVAGVVYEGYQVHSEHGKKRRKGGQVYERHYCHITVYVLRHPEPFNNKHWKIHFGIGGLPALGYDNRIAPPQFSEYDALADRAPRRIHPLNTPADHQRHDIAFFDHTRRLGNDPANYLGWDVVINRLR